jgi:hypothetical protein
LTTGAAEWRHNEKRARLRARHILLPVPRSSCIYSLCFLRAQWEIILDVIDVHRCSSAAPNSHHPRRSAATPPQAGGEFVKA